MRSKPRVVVTRRWPAPCEERLRERFDAVLNEDDRPLDGDALRAALGRCDALLCTVTDRIDAAVLDAEPLTARLIGNFGVGYNHVDVGAARARGLTVTNTPDVLTDCTADLAVALMLMAARRAGEGERELRAGRWSGWRPTHLLGTRVSGKTLGVVGFGRIGRAVAERAHRGFGMRILVHGPRPPAQPDLAAVDGEYRADLDAMLREADFVSLHCPARPETRHLIDRRRLALMGPQAFLVNTARGDVVDEHALAEALRAGVIAGAGLDVYEAEPVVDEGLKALENVVLLPHLGSGSAETRTAMGMRVIENVEAFFAGREPPDRVV